MENTENTQNTNTSMPPLSDALGIPVTPTQQAGPLPGTMGAAALGGAAPAVAATPPAAPVNNNRPSLWRRWTGQTRAYLAEYAVLLIVLSSLIYLTSTLFSGIIDYFGADKHAWYWSGSWAYKASIGELAAAVALIPILVLLTKRTGGTEDIAPASKQSSWRKAFLGVFLITLGLTAVGYAIGFIYVVASALSNAGLAADTDSRVWQALVKNGFAVLLFGLSALLYARDYRGTQEGNLLLWRRIHRYGLVTFALIAVIVFAALPLSRQRGAYVDDLIVGDFNTISNKVSTYASSNQKLPADLNALDLTKEVKTRSKNLGYEYKPSASKSSGQYELCATFKTDASNKDDANPIEALSGLSNSSSNDFSQSASTHKKGHQCFKKTASGLRGASGTGRSGASSLPSSSYDDFNYDDYQGL